MEEAHDPARPDPADDPAPGEALRHRVDTLVAAGSDAMARIRAALETLARRPPSTPPPARDEVAGAELRAAQEALVAARSEAAGLREALDAARERHAALTAAGTSGDAAVHELRARVEEDEVLRQALDAARGRLAALERSTVPLAEKERLERRERELLVRTGLLAQRLADLERYAEENALLRSRLGELEAMRQRTALLEARLPAAPEAGGVPGEAEPALAPGERPGEAAPLVGATVAGALEAELRTVLAASRGRSAVLADAHGFPLVGAGDREPHEALGVLSSLAQELGRWTSDLLALGDATSVDVQGTGPEGLRLRLFALGDDRLGLALLGPAGARAEAAEEAALVHFTHVLAAREPPG